jgi:NADPH2:quinone reductase
MKIFNKESVMVAVVRVHRTGGPEVLTYEDIQVPAPGAGQIRIRQRACGVNYIDTYFRMGMYPSPVGMPFVAGNEGSGDVIAVGPGVNGIKVGDRVAYVVPLGGYSAERLLPADRVVKVPANISHEQAASMMLKGMTAQYLLNRSYKVGKGSTILVHAAAGGVGVILCQWGKALGATVIGTVGSEEKAAIAKANGAHHTILYRKENFAARVKEITNGKLCDVVYDGIGKDTFPASLDCIRPLGLFASFGSASGQIAALNINILQTKGSLFATRPTLNTYVAKREDLLNTANDLFKVVGSGKVKIQINQKYALKDAQKAHMDLEGRATTGSTILIP